MIRINVCLGTESKSSDSHFSQGVVKIFTITAVRKLQTLANVLFVCLYNCFFFFEAATGKHLINIAAAAVLLPHFTLSLFFYSDAQNFCVHSQNQ